METHPNDYRISFFKPTTPIARYNRNLIIWLVLIWAVAIFGFQIALKLLEKPTPEQAYIEFENVWSPVQQGTAASADLQIFAQSCLSVLGKNFILQDEKAALNEALTWAVFRLTPEDQSEILLQRILDFQSLRNTISNITDSDYVRAKNELAAFVSPIIGLNGRDIRTRLLAPELISTSGEQLSAESKVLLPEIMSKYLIHNQSFLTDFQFLGFPFHYFYTAIFLLILFIGLCWLYCIRIDRRNVLLEIKD